MKRRGCVGGALRCLLLIGFAVGGMASDPPRARLLAEHVDIGVSYQPDDLTNKLAVVVSDDDHGRVYLSNEVSLVAVEVAKLLLPPGTMFGEEGSPLWVLPQSQNSTLLYLGLSGEALSAGTFGSEIELRLVACDGPGQFFLWQAGAFGEFDLRMSTADGISDGDVVRLTAGSHGHFNWGFTTNGVYAVVVQASGQRRGVGTNDFSLPTALRFEVEPLPSEPEKPFAIWQRRQWPGVSDLAVIGPDADPDGDRVVNAVEYALGSDPHTSGGPGWPWPVVLSEGTQSRAELRFRTPQSATDVEFRCWKGHGLAHPDWVRLPGPEPSADPVPDGFTALRFMGEMVADSQSLFLKLEVLLR